MMKYFKYEDEYGEPTEILMKDGTLISYISSTFLNGWINYVKPLAVRLITRYSDQEDDGYEGNVARVKVWQENPQHHADLSFFKDDILILGVPDMWKWRSEPTNEYWFFWFDQDVSDCQIGRFTTEDSRETVLKNFIDYADHISEKLSVDYGASPTPVKSLEIKLETLRGWIKF